MSDLRGFAATRLGPLARRVPFSPNTITLFALLFTLAAAACLALGAQWRAAFPAAIVLAGVGGLLDVLDGIVAREKGLTSRWGDFLDHFCDRVSDLALLAGWILGAQVTSWIGLVALVAVALVGYAGTQLEASFGRREYETTGRGEYFVAVLLLPGIAWIGGEAAMGMRIGGVRLFDALTLIVAAGALLGVVQRLREARKSARAVPESGSS